MSTTQDNSKKTDHVLALLRELAASSDSEVVKFLLYANPSCSGLVTSSTSAKAKQEVDQNIALYNSKLVDVYQGKPFNYEGLERGVRKVFIPSRISFAIKSLLTVLKLANLFLTKINIEDALGNEWPQRVRDASTGKIVKEQGEIYIDRSVINSLISHVENELSVTLPKIIDLMYERKYVAIGAFTYSLTEIKCYGVDQNFLGSVCAWLSGSFIPSFRSQLDDDRIGVAKANRPIHGVQVVTTDITTPKKNLIREEWCDIKISARAKEPSFPPSYEKFARLTATRLGKNLFTKEDAKFMNDSVMFIDNFKQLIAQYLLPRFFQAVQNSQIRPSANLTLSVASIEEYLSLLRNANYSIYTAEYRSADSLLSVASLISLVDEAKTKQIKNDFQELMRKLFLEVVLSYMTITSTLTSDSIAISDDLFILVKDILTFVYNASKYIDLDVYICKLDVFMQYANSLADDTFTQFIDDCQTLSRSAYVNERLMMSIHKFIAIYSDFVVRAGSAKDARKQIPLDIERAIVGLRTFGNIKLTDIVDPTTGGFIPDAKPGLVISSSNIGLIADPELRQKYVVAWNAVNNGQEVESGRALESSGFTQKSVMSIMSASRVNPDDSEDKLDVVTRTQLEGTFTTVKLIANRFDVYATLLEKYTALYFEHQEKIQQAQAKSVREEENKMKALQKFMADKNLVPVQQFQQPVQQFQQPVHQQNNYPPVHSPEQGQAPISFVPQSNVVPPVVLQSENIPAPAAFHPMADSTQTIASGAPPMMPTLPGVVTGSTPVMPTLPGVVPPIATGSTPVMPPVPVAGGSSPRLNAPTSPGLGHTPSAFTNSGVTSPPLGASPSAFNN